MRTVGWKQKLVTSDLGSEHVRNLITMHIEREAKKKKKQAFSCLFFSNYYCLFIWPHGLWES